MESEKLSSTSRAKIYDLARAGAFFYLENEKYGLATPSNDLRRLRKVLDRHPDALRQFMLSAERFGHDEILVAVNGPPEAEDPAAALYSVSLNDLAAREPLGFAPTVEYRRDGGGSRYLLFRAPRGTPLAEVVLNGGFCVDPEALGFSIAGLIGHNFAVLPGTIGSQMSERQTATPEERVLSEILRGW